MFHFFKVLKNIGFLACLVLGGCVSKFNDSHWVEVTQDDLKSVRNTILLHSAPAENPEYSSFQDWLQKGFKQANVHALKVKNKTDYMAVLQFYVNGFKADHLAVSSTVAEKRKQWNFPGFLLKKEQQKYVVGYTALKNSREIEIGTQVLEIEGKPIDLYMKETIIPLYANQDIQAKYKFLAPLILVDRENFLVKRPQEITILNPEGQQKVYPLIWRPREASELQQLSRTLPFGKSPLMGVKSFHEGVWITIPTFKPNEDQKRKFLQIFKELQDFRERPFIVFDLRGNGGGDSRWERPVLRNLYGDAYIKSLKEKHGYNETWAKKIRVSQKNYENLKASLGVKRAQIFEENIKKGKAFHTVTWNILRGKNNHLFSHQDTPKSFPKVYLLTDGRCGSTCWLFVREMLQIPNVIQIGEETLAQSLYSQARWINLPGARARVFVPMQERIAPIDHMGKPFVPTFVYTGDWNDEIALQKWIRGIIKKDGAA